MKTKFYNKNGDLSFYSLICGYVQREEKKQHEERVVHGALNLSRKGI